MKPATIIAATFSTDSASINDCRYQPSRCKRAIFAVGDEYYAVGQTAPTEPAGVTWKPHSDQFFAKQENTTLWVGV